jgi:hypothetical protein
MAAMMVIPGSEAIGDYHWKYHCMPWQFLTLSLSSIQYPGTHTPMLPRFEFCCKA